MIINIRGANGSGKSHLVRLFMKKYSTTPVMQETEVSRTKTLLGDKVVNRSSIIGYSLPSINFRVVGSYETACGGCDGIHTQQEIKDRITEFSKSGNVLFEGMMISTIVGKWIEYSKSHNGMIWAFMDTPYPVCFKRIQERNGGKDISEILLRDKFNRQVSHFKTAQAAGEKVFWIDHKNPLNDLLRIINETSKSKTTS